MADDGRSSLPNRKKIKRKEKIKKDMKEFQNAFHQRRDKEEMIRVAAAFYEKIVRDKLRQEEESERLKLEIRQLKWEIREIKIEVRKKQAQPTD